MTFAGFDDRFSHGWLLGNGSGHYAATKQGADR